MFAIDYYVKVYHENFKIESKNSHNNKFN